MDEAAPNSATHMDASERRGANSREALPSERPIAAPGPCPSPDPIKCNEKFNDEIGKIILFIYSALISYCFVNVGSFFLLVLFTYGKISYLNEFKLNEVIKILFIILLPLSVFMSTIVEDCVEISRIRSDHPITKPARFIHELIICFFYLLSIVFSLKNNILSVFSFSIALFWGGIWFRSLKNENTYDHLLHNKPFKLSEYMQYIGGISFLIVFIVYLVSKNAIYYGPVFVTIFYSVYLAWKLIRYIFLKVRESDYHADYVFELSPIGLLGRLVWGTRGENKSSNETPQSVSAPS